MRICIASDHGGYRLKQELLPLLRDEGFDVEDLGSYDEQSCDYPDYGAKAARAVADGLYELGLLICGTGAGISMAAGKIPGIRCACASEPATARLMREHNDANMLAIGARIVGIELALDIVLCFLRTPFSHGERHQRRINLISALDAKQSW